MNDILYIIPCKIDTINHLQHLQRCINSILRYLVDGDKILIVDANSIIRHHFNIYRNDHRLILSNHINVNYEAGALLYAFHNYHYARYLLIHDSCELIGDPKHLKGNVHVFHYVDDPWGRDLVSAFMGNKTKWRTIPNGFLTIVGSISLFRRELLQLFYTNGLEKLFATNKIESCLFERIFGIILMLEGYEGELRNNDRLPIKKHYLSRQ